MSLEEDIEECVGHRHFNYSVVVDREAGCVFDGETEDDLAVREDQYFLQFSESTEPSAEFLCIVPRISSGVELEGIWTFRCNANFYAKAVNSLVKPALLELIKAAKGFGCENLFMMIPHDLENLMNLVHILSYIGFHQVPPEDQRKISSAPGVLMLLKINQL